MMLLIGVSIVASVLYTAVMITFGQYLERKYGSDLYLPGLLVIILATVIIFWMGILA